MSSWPAKDPDEVLDYDVRWTKRLYSATELAAYQAAVDGGMSESDALDFVVPADTVQTSTFTLPPGITANSSSRTSFFTKVWLSGGTEGQTYSIVNEIVTAAGRTMDKTNKIKIKSK